jgi:transposase
MGVSYSQDLRDRVLSARDRGLKTRQVADLFCVSASWVRRVVQRRREDGQTAPRPRGGVTVVRIDMGRLAELVRQKPDATIRELHAMLGAPCVESAVGMALKRLGLSLKKRRSTPRSGTDRMSPSVASGGSSASRGSTPDA